MIELPVSHSKRQCRLKYCTARSCLFAAASVLKVPRLRLFPVLGFFLREYSRYSPERSFLIIASYSLDKQKFRSTVCRFLKLRRPWTFMGEIVLFCLGCSETAPARIIHAHREKLRQCVIEG